MLKTIFKMCLTYMLVGLVFPAMAATFSVVDLSGKQDCSTMTGITSLNIVDTCSLNPPGTVQVNITPQAGEFPTTCHNFDSGSFCAYNANFYVAARYQNSWYSKPRYTWTPITPDQLAPTISWPLFAGTGTMSYVVRVGELNTNTGRFDLPLPGIEVYVGIAPFGSPVFTPNTVKQIYPVP